MTFVAIPDKAAGDQVTLTMWNAVKDNLNKGVLRPISHSELSGSSASVTFSSIAADWVDLVVVVRTMNTVGTTPRLLRCNGDTGANYGSQYISWTPIAATAAAAATSINVGTDTSAVAAGFGGAVILINNYAGSTHKTVTWWAASGDTNCYPESGSGYWASTAAITSITILAGTAFASGSTFTLYGVSGI